jgi:hypothetical protein
MMFKKLLLTVALLSTSYGSADFFDPDFSGLSNRSENFVMDESGVVIYCGEENTFVLHRLTQAEVADVLNSKDCNVLMKARTTYNQDILHLLPIYMTLNADITPRNGISPAKDAEFLSTLFWNRVSLFEQTLEKMLSLPTTVTTDESFTILKSHYDKLMQFSATHDRTDLTPFETGNLKQLTELIDAFAATYGA